MRFFNWAETFKETPKYEDILSKVTKTEIAYWIWLIISIGIALMGLAIIIAAPTSNLKLHFIGLLLAIDGCINVALIKIWVHIRLSMYRIIWDSKNRIEGEIKKLEAEDL